MGGAEHHRAEVNVLLCHRAFPRRADVKPETAAWQPEQTAHRSGRRIRVLQSARENQHLLHGLGFRAGLAELDQLSDLIRNLLIEKSLRSCVAEAPHIQPDIPV